MQQIQPTTAQSSAHLLLQMEEGLPRPMQTGQRDGAAAPADCWLQPAGGPVYRPIGLRHARLPLPLYQQILAEQRSVVRQPRRLGALDMAEMMGSMAVGSLLCGMMGLTISRDHGISEYAQLRMGTLLGATSGALGLTCLVLLCAGAHRWHALLGIPLPARRLFPAAGKMTREQFCRYICWPATAQTLQLQAESIRNTLLDLWARLQARGIIGDALAAGYHEVTCVDDLEQEVRAALAAMPKAEQSQVLETWVVRISDVMRLVASTARAAQQIHTRQEIDRCRQRQAHQLARLETEMLAGTGRPPRGAAEQEPLLQAHAAEGPEAAVAPPPAVQQSLKQAYALTQLQLAQQDRAIAGCIPAPPIDPCARAAQKLAEGALPAGQVRRFVHAYKKVVGEPAPAEAPAWELTLSRILQPAGDALDGGEQHPL